MTVGGLDEIARLRFTLAKEKRMTTLAGCNTFTGKVWTDRNTKFRGKEEQTMSTLRKGDMWGGATPI